MNALAEMGQAHRFNVGFEVEIQCARAVENDQSGLEGSIDTEAFLPVKRCY